MCCKNLDSIKCDRWLEFVMETPPILCFRARNDPQCNPLILPKTGIDHYKHYDLSCTLENYP